MKFKSKIEKIIELTSERKRHIIKYHPDVKAHLSKIGEVLRNPDEIRKSKHDPEVLLFYKYFANIKEGKYLAAVVKINERSFILSAYLTERIITGKRIYEEKQK